jgi:hypothetical protein
MSQIRVCVAGAGFSIFNRRGCRRRPARETSVSDAQSAARACSRQRSINQREFALVGSAVYFDSTGIEVKS